MFDELIHAIMEQWSNFAVNFFAGIDAPRVLGFLIPVVPACYGIYVKWRNSGYRLLDRLDEFLDQQEKRLVGSRKTLATLFDCPSPAHGPEQPVFNAKNLSRALRKMNWGYGFAAVNDLKSAVAVSAAQAARAQTQIDEFQKRRALAHLLLGAKEASRNLRDRQARRASREAALEQFDRAIGIDGNDTDAIEYAGMMLLELGNPAGALGRFNQLIELRGPEGGVALARAYRLLAIAHANMPTPQYAHANAALGNALNAFPAGTGLEKALTHEQRGNVRVSLGFHSAANGNFQEALTLYQSIRTTQEGRAGLDRVTRAIANLNREQSDGQVDLGSSEVPTDASSVKWWTKLARPSG